LGLFGRRLTPAGLPLAGFGLLFVGLGRIQSFMPEVASTLSMPSGSTFLGLLTLTLLGTIMTVIVQSSSVAVVATIVALQAGVIDLAQAAALVVGQNLGTTSTALLASIGVNNIARRVAWAHTAFNLLTAVVALPFLLLFTRVDLEPMIALALFHTLFNATGVLLIAPWLSGFTRLVSRQG
jgi:phosphate:Na+ symporter